MNAGENAGKGVDRPPDEASPKRTYALVVGIEQYEAGTTWDLPGPATDALDFTSWLRARGVPADQILLFLSPLANELPGASLPTGVATRPADSEPLKEAITRTLPRWRGDLLWLFWAGHGVLTGDNDLRLFYADASVEDKRNLNLDALLTALRSDQYPGLPRQIGLVDACQTYAERMQLAKTLPNETFARGQPLTDRKQFVLYATSPGQSAINLGSARAGLFTKNVMDELTGPGSDGWPPDMEGIAARLDQHFDELRAADRADQTPTSFRWRPWSGGQRILGETVPPATGTSTVKTRRRPRGSALEELVNRLLALDVLATIEGRQNVLSQLRQGLATRIRSSSESRTHVVNIVSRCLEYPGGLTELMDAVKLYTGPDDPAFIEADEAARRLIEAVERAPRGVTELPVKPSAPAALLTELASRIQQLPIGASDSRLAVIAVDLEEIAAALANALKDTEDVALLEIELGDIQTLLGSFGDSSPSRTRLRELRKAGERLRSYGHSRWPGEVD